MMLAPHTHREDRKAVNAPPSTRAHVPRQTTIIHKSPDLLCLSCSQPLAAFPPPLLQSHHAHGRNTRPAQDAQVSPEIQVRLHKMQSAQNKGTYNAQTSCT